MKFAGLTALAIAALSATTDAAFAKVVNKCTFPVYAWSVGPDQQSGPRHNIPANGGTYQETYRGLGISIKLSKSKNVNSLFDGSPITQFQYSDDTANKLVYYSLADTHGDIFAPNRVRLAPSDTSCPKIVWAQGSGMSEIDACEDGSNLVLTACA